jgi:hypothetical protein
VSFSVIRGEKNIRHHPLGASGPMLTTRYSMPATPEAAPRHLERMNPAKPITNWPRELDTGRLLPGTWNLELRAFGGLKKGYGSFVSSTFRAWAAR